MLNKAVLNFILRNKTKFKYTLINFKYGLKIINPQH